MPSLDSGQNALMCATDLKKTFLSRRLGAEQVIAVNGVTLSLARGSCLGLVGETGSGKSTLARLLLRLTDPDSGSITFDGADLLSISQQGLRQFRAQAQIVFQDPYDSADPLTTNPSNSGRTVTSPRHA